MHTISTPLKLFIRNTTSRNPANCVWSRTLGNSCRSLGLEVTALEQIMKTQVQLISTHVRGGGDGNCFSRSVKFSLGHIGKMLQLPAPPVTSFWVTRGKSGYADTVAGMKKSWIQSNGNENFHLLLYPQRHPSCTSIYVVSAHPQQAAATGPATRELLQVLPRWKLDALMLTIFLWTTTW